VAVNPNTNRIYVANGGSNTVSVISNTYADVMAVTDSIALVSGRSFADSASISDSIETSFVAAPVPDDDDDDDDDDDRHGRGGGGRDRVVIINNNDNNGQKSCPATIFPESYFANNPLERICVSNARLIDAFGTGIGVAAVGQQVSISATLTNRQQVAQDYAFIVQITDEDGEVVFIGWQNGNIGGGAMTDVSISWTPGQAGEYTVRIFVWDGLQVPAQPLSTVTTVKIEVTISQ
jgi:YVTN family beta-propeller protein